MFSVPARSSFESVQSLRARLQPQRQRKDTRRHSWGFECQSQPLHSLLLHQHRPAGCLGHRSSVVPVRSRVACSQRSPRVHIPRRSRQEHPRPESSPILVGESSHGGSSPSRQRYLVPVKVPAPKSNRPRKFPLEADHSLWLFTADLVIRDHSGCWRLNG